MGEVGGVSVAWNFMMFAPTLRQYTLRVQLAGSRRRGRSDDSDSCGGLAERAVPTVFVD